MKKIIVLFLVSTLQVYSQYDLNYTIEDLNIFWNKAFLGKKFIEPKINYYDINNPIKTKCGEFNNLNAFYCPTDNSISISIDLMKLFISKKMNNAFIYAIVAHEYGHAAQKQLGIFNQRKINLELQADCLAGLFFNYALHQRRVTREDFTTINKFYIEVSDKNKDVNYYLGDEAHGNYKMRTDAFMYGVYSGDAKECINKY